MCLEVAELTWGLLSPLVRALVPIVPFSCVQMSLGGYSQRAIEAYEDQLRAEAIGAREGEEECVFPQRVMDRLAV